MRAVAYFESWPLTSDFALRPRWSSAPIGAGSSSWGAEDEAIDHDYQRAARHARPEEESYRLTIDRGRFLAAVKAQLAPVLGAGAPFSTTHEWRYDTPLGPWTLVTLIDVGGRAHQLAYSHDLHASVSRPLRQGVSLCGWLGIGGGHTTWDRLTQADTAEAARSLARVCAHFVQAAPALVDGVAPD
jgi:hypothetical protein